MAHIEPFRALRYDPARVALGQVVTQPYDKITLEMQQGYYAASPYNLVRIILGQQQAADNVDESVYTRAASCFRDWRRQGIFLQDSQPSIYLYVQRFMPPGGKSELERRGFIALGRVEDYSDEVVFRHEQTLAKPKADRLELLRATRAQFGQLFMLYSDPTAEIEGLLATTSPPDIETVDENNVSSRVWKISDPHLIDLIRGKMRDKKLIIADGHHRYETALAYRDERRTTDSSATLVAVPRERSPQEVMVRRQSRADAPYELAMMTFVNMDSPGLVILPTHRVVHDLPTFSTDALVDAACGYFSVEEVDPSIDGPRANGILREATRSGTALLAITASRAFLLDRPKAKAFNLLAGLSLQQQALDVLQLHKCLLEGALGISEEDIRAQRNLRYVRDTNEAIAQARSQAANVAFLISPVRMKQVRDIAFAGEVLPQKSTDFYPKLLSGLTIYALE